MVSYFNIICTIQYILKETVIYHAGMSAGPHICYATNQK